MGVKSSEIVCQNIERRCSMLAIFSGLKIGPSGFFAGNVKMERGLDFSRHRSGVQRVWLANGGLAVLATPGKTESGSAGTQSGEGYSGRRCAKGATGARQHLAAVGF